MFVLDEIYVRGPKLIYEHMRVGNSRENIPKDHPRVLEERPKLVAKTAQGNLTYESQSTASGLVDGPLVMGVGRYLY